MCIAILAPEKSGWEHLAALLCACTDFGGKVNIRRYNLDAPLYHPLPEKTSVVFAMVNDMKSLTATRGVVCWNENLPLVMVCRSPDYAMEAIRLGVKYYLLEPLCLSDVKEAMGRVFAKPRLVMG